jgi:hypothetical protein
VAAAVGVIAQGAQGYLREIEMHKQRIAEDQQEKRKLHNTIQVTPTHAPRPAHGRVGRQPWLAGLCLWDGGGHTGCGWRSWDRKHVES